MKILAINGSHKGKNGYTHFLIETLFSGAKKADAHCHEIALAELEINPCTGCGTCQKKDTPQKCIYHKIDDTNAIFKQMAEADYIVYAMPVYLFGMPSLIKTFLERMYSLGNSSNHCLSDSGMFFHKIDKGICSKPFLLLINHDNFEKAMSHSIIAFFETFSLFMDAPQVGRIIRTSGGLTAYGKNLNIERKYPKISECYHSIAKAGFELASAGKIKKTTQRKASKDIINMPFIHVLKSTTFFRKRAITATRNGQ